MGFERYVDYALDVPMYFVYRNGRYIDVAGASFRDFIAGKSRAASGRASDLRRLGRPPHHALPGCRLKRFMEMRGADAGSSLAGLMALPAFWIGLLYDATALGEASALVADWSLERSHGLARSGSASRARGAVSRRQGSAGRARGGRHRRAGADAPGADRTERRGRAQASGAARRPPCRRAAHRRTGCLPTYKNRLAAATSRVCSTLAPFEPRRGRRGGSHKLRRRRSFRREMRWSRPACSPASRSLRVDALALAGRLGLGQLRPCVSTTSTSASISRIHPAIRSMSPPESSLHLFVSNHATALTLLSAFAGAAVASMFYLLVRRQLDAPYALGATLIMALTPLFWLQSGLALTDMFGMMFVLAFLLVEGAATPERARRSRQTDRLRSHRRAVARGATAFHAYHCRLLVHPRGYGAHYRRQACLDGGGRLRGGCGAVADTGLARNRRPRNLFHRHGRPVQVALRPPSCLGAWQPGRRLCLVRPRHHPHRLGRPGLRTDASSREPPWQARAVRALGGHAISRARVAQPFQGRGAALHARLRSLSSHDLHHAAGGDLRYFLPFSLIVGWSVPAYLALFRRPAVRAAALVPLLAVTVLPSFFLVGGLAKVPPPVAAFEWIRANRPTAVFYSGPLKRHALFYWPEGDLREAPKTDSDCATFRSLLESGRPVLSTRNELCGISGRESRVVQARLAHSRQAQPRLHLRLSREFRRPTVTGRCARGLKPTGAMHRCQRKSPPHSVNPARMRRESVPRRMLGRR